MFIKSIKLNNYRCHKNSKIDFFNDGDKGKISIIEGNNSDGKTCIFNAIGWCLYGKETSELLGEDQQSLGIPNVRLAETGNPESLSVELWIAFEGESVDSPIATMIKRSANFRFDKIAEERIIMELYYNTGGPKVLRDKDAQRYIEDLIPPNLVEFYMFNGEYLKSSKNSMGKNIDSSIKGQFKIGAMESMAKLLEDVGNEYRKSSEKAAGIDNSDISNQIKENGKEIEKLKEKKSSLEREYNDYLAKKDEAKNKFEKINGEIKEIQGKKSMLNELAKKDEELRQIANELNNERSKLYKTQYEYSYLALSKSTTEESYKLVKGEIGRANLPPSIKEDFLNDLLAQHKCICGRPLEEESEEYKNVQGMLLGVQNESKKNLLLDLAPELKKISSDMVESAKDNIKEAKNRINNLYQIERHIVEERSSMDSKKNDLSKEEQEKLDEYKNSNEDYGEFDALSRNAKDRLNEIETDIKKLEDKNKELIEKEERISAKFEKAKKFNEYYRCSMELKDIISKLSNRIPYMFIENLQDEANQLISGIEELSHISLGIKLEGNSIKVVYIDKYIGLKGKSYLSDGQIQIISIALMAAYISVLKKLGAGISESPFIVMDHPFSDLSFPHKEELLKAFPIIFKDTNVIILSPIGDFNLSAASCAVASYYKVHNDKQEKVCVVEKDEI